MSADRVEFSGAMTALVTPFREDGSIDFEAYGQLVEKQIAGGNLRNLLQQAGER